MDSDLYDHRYKLAVGIAVASILLVLVVPILGFVYGFVSETVSRLLIAGLGSLGTILLAALTLLSILNNRVLVQERLKDREKPVQRALLRDVVDSGLSAIRSTRSKVIEGEIDWTDTSLDHRWGQFLAADLEPCFAEADPVTVEQFEQSYPEVARMVWEYDSTLRGLSTAAEILVEQLDDPVTQIQRETPTISRQNRDDIIKFLLMGRAAFGPANNDLPDWWIENREQIHDEMTDEIPGLEDWDDDLQDLLELAQNIEDELTEVKYEIQSEYGIDLDHETATE